MPLTRAADITPERVRWLWPGYIPFGKVAIVDGDPGLGKSTLLIDVAARLSVGAELPNGKRHRPMGTILLMGEDGAGDTIVPRLMNAGADLALVAIRDTYTNDKGDEIPPSFPADVGRLKEDIIEAEAGMVVIDPVMSYLDPDVNSHNDQQVRRALMPLAQLAEETGCAIVMLRHLNKSSGGSSLYRGGGSIGFVGVARSALLVARDPEDPMTVVLASNKSNLGPPPPSLTFRLVGCDNGAARVEWGAHSSHTAESLVQIQGDENERNELRDATEFLRDALANGPLLVTVAKRQARDANISDMTLRRAKMALRVVSKKARTQDGQWTWELPPPSAGEGVQARDTPPDMTPLTTLTTLNTFNIYLEDGQDNQDGQGGQDHPATTFAGDPPLATATGPGFDCATCGGPIRYAVVGKPLLCNQCREGYTLARLAAD